jgi:GNAT superfamily N-acetyltransferase
MSTTKKRKLPRNKSSKSGPTPKKGGEPKPGRVQQVPETKWKREADRLGLPRPVKMTLTPFDQGNLFRNSREVGVVFHQENVCTLVNPDVPAWQLAATFRAPDGTLCGKLVLYPDGLPGYFEPGEYIIQVRDTYQGMGIGLVLLREMEEHHRINFHIQRYSESGRALAAKYLTMYPR